MRAAASASSVSSDCGRSPRSISWISSTSRAVSGVGTPASRAERHDDAELRIDLGGPLADGEVAPDAAVRLGRLPVVRDELVERSLGGAGAARRADTRRDRSRRTPRA